MDDDLQYAGIAVTEVDVQVTSPVSANTLHIRNATGGDGEARLLPVLHAKSGQSRELALSSTGPG